MFKDFLRYGVKPCLPNNKLSITIIMFNTLTTEKKTTKFSSANFQKKNQVQATYHIQNSKTRGQTV